MKLLAIASEDISNPFDAESRNKLVDEFTN